jgi:hypothetical protein
LAGPGALTSIMLLMGRAASSVEAARVIAALIAVMALTLARRPLRPRNYPPSSCSDMRLALPPEAVVSMLSVRSLAKRWR